MSQSSNDFDEDFSKSEFSDSFYSKYSQLKEETNELISFTKNKLTEDENKNVRFKIPSFLNGMKDKIYEKLNYYLSTDNEVEHSLYNLKNDPIDLKQLCLEKNKLIYNIVHNDIKRITFLISGYLTENIDAESNFYSFTQDHKKINSSKDLIINFRWKSSSQLNLFKLFLNDLLDKYLLKKSFTQDNEVVKFCENYLSNLMSQAGLNSFFQKFVFFIIRTILFFINTYLLFSRCIEFVNIIMSLLNSAIKNFKHTYQKAKQSGIFLSKIIIDIKNRFPSLNVDLMGHSLGTVVIQSSLSNLQDKKLCRYIILMGGVATIQGMQSCAKTFQKCINYYSKNDEVLKELLHKGGILGKGSEFVGLNPFKQNDKQFIDKQLQIGHMEYNKLYSDYHNNALQQMQFSIWNIPVERLLEDYKMDAIKVAKIPIVSLKDNEIKEVQYNIIKSKRNLNNIDKYINLTQFNDILEIKIKDLRYLFV